MSVTSSIDIATAKRRRLWLCCNGQQLKLLLDASLLWLDLNHEAINALNVFPVPDGDSGTNMLLTMQSACKEIASLPNRSAGGIMQAVAKGALMGARGNSGVILSQFFRGMADSFGEKETINAAEFAHALREGTRLAYQGVQKPVEGTILTVARELSEAAARAAAESDDLHHVLTAVVAEAQRSVARTPEIFPLLSEAGVVDAGGQGLFVILQGALKLVNGEKLAVNRVRARAASLTALKAEAGWGFDIQYILHGENLHVDQIRQTIESMGESVLVVGDSRLIKVHAHAPTPGPILDYGVMCGVISKVIVENMEEQVQQILKSQAKPPIAAEAISGIATIVVASGAGLQRVFDSLGASRIVTGGATMNPSVEDLLKAIEAVDARNVILLPNDKNILLAAQQAAQLTSKAVRIVPSIAIPQGIAALLAYNFQANLDTNADAMNRTLNTVQTGEITRAVRTVSIDGLNVREGQIIALLNGVLCVAGDNLSHVALELLRRMTLVSAEILTIYVGQDASGADAHELADRIRTTYRHLTVEVVDGGQPHTLFIISVE
ncbi:MAG: DAK2 domain-containing protein [Chloroflexi bacterium]|nr:DAK2 domain-containing protein [Chloroflexota bacterium]